MGDAAHQARKSDHNLGNAIDITQDPTFRVAELIAVELRRQMVGAGTGGRITYIIWNRFIASPESSWKWRIYKGPNPHTSHVHISIKATHRNQVRPWVLP